VTVNGDPTIEASETFYVNLTNPTNATIWDAQGVGTITDDDAPVTCTSFSISPTSADPDYQAGSQVVTITGSPAGCAGGAWTTSGNGSWLTVLPASGSGPGSATVSWTENAGVPRTDDATIAGKTFTVTQTGPSADFFTLPPCRLLDTRQPGPSGGVIWFGTTRTVLVTGGTCLVPTSATAVALNVTVTTPTAAGNCRLYPGGAVPQVSNINFSAGQTRGNNTIIPISPGGTISVYCSPGTSASVHVILDVDGYFE
jgi:hypothetical protein